MASADLLGALRGMLGLNMSSAQGPEQHFAYTSDTGTPYDRRKTEDGYFWPSRWCDAFGARPP